jgi:hypothetical protein
MVALSMLLKDNAWPNRPDVVNVVESKLIVFPFPLESIAELSKCHLPWRSVTGDALVVGI